MEFPSFLINMLEIQYGKETTHKIIEGYMAQRNVTLRANTLKSSSEEIQEKLAEANIAYETVNWSKEAFILKTAKEEDIRKLSIYEEGKIYLQSLSSMLPPIILAPQEKENILDMAAAPGGKTTQMAALSNNHASITACEISKIRAERLKYNLAKQGAGSVYVMVADATKLDDFFAFDKILLDAPCSGSGTITENTDFENTFTQTLIQKSVRLQTLLLTKALKLLKPGHEMVYSTCSILKEENEEVVEKVLKSKQAEIVPITLDTEGITLLRTNLPGTLCVCPSKLYEGFFIAKIRKL